MKKHRCIVCQKEIKPAMKDGDVWNEPCDAVSLEGGSNFGSSMYDSLIDGILVQVLICDDCLKNAKRCRISRDIRSRSGEPIEVEDEFAWKQEDIDNI